MKTFDGLRLDVRTYGPADAPLTVVLAHCWTLNQQGWHYQVRDLLREFGHGIRIVTWDARGHGESDEAPLEACQLTHLARDMSDVLDQYAASPKLVLAGHSIGGMTIMQLAADRPEIFERVVGTVFVATSSGQLNTVTLGLPEFGERVRSQIPRMLALRSRTLTKKARRRLPVIERLVVRRFLMGKPIRLADAALTVEGIITSPAATMVGFYQTLMLHDAVEALKVLDGIETHVLVGSHDLLTPPEHSRVIADNIDGAVLTVAPGAGHMLPLERDELVSGTLVRLVRQYL